MPGQPGSAALRRREIAFLLSDVARLLRTATDQKAAEFGTTRARWAVLVRIQRHEGLNQNELASLLDIQPITLGRLVDKLCEEGLVERRPDPSDRRVRRLHLTPKAVPVIEGLSSVGAGITGAALEGIDEVGQARLLEALQTIKSNLKRQAQADEPEPAPEERPVTHDKTRAATAAARRAS